METHHITIPDTSAGERLDKALSVLLSDISRARVQALLIEGNVQLNNITVADAKKKVRTGETYTVMIPAAIPAKPEAQAMALDIRFEDEHMLVLNKQAGLTVHPAPGNMDRTLVNALLAHCGETLSGIGGVARPGIVHRLDKDTSGLMVVAKHDRAHRHLSKQLADRTLSRTYQALCWGQPIPSAGTITGNIGRSPRNRKKMAVVLKGGKEAQTHYKRMQQLGPVSLIECVLESGRTHQIRVHMTHIGHSLVGDPLYGSSPPIRALEKARLPEEAITVLRTFPRQALHAAAIGFIHPVSEERLHFSAALPEDMHDLLRIVAL